MRDSLADGGDRASQRSGLDDRPAYHVSLRKTTRPIEAGRMPLPGSSQGLFRRAVAVFMLDAIEQKKHFHKVVGIAK